MKTILNYFVRLCNFIGIMKVNLACDWIWYQDSENIELSKYRKF